MKRLFNSIQSGKTMTEMLAVLFIIGILSLAILTGFTYAMEKYHANETVEEIRGRASDVIYNSLHHGKMTASSDWKSTAHNDKPVSYDLSMSEIDYLGEKRQPFSVTVEDISRPVCEKMLDMGFAMPYKIEVNDALYADNSAHVCLKSGNKMAYYFIMDASAAGIADKDDGQECEHNYECKSGACVDETCVECSGNWDCENGVCDLSINKCVDCLTDSDCSKGKCENNVCSTCEETGCAAGFVCDPQNGRCVVCISDDDCPGDDVCNTAIPACVKCIDDDDCTGNEVCDTSIPKCVACVDDDDCPGSWVCDKSIPQCVECLKNDDCEGNMLCDTDQKKCVECFSNADCPYNEKGYCNLENNTCEVCAGRCAKLSICPQYGIEPPTFTLCGDSQPAGRSLAVYVYNASGMKPSMGTTYFATSDAFDKIEFPGLPVGTGMTFVFVANDEGNNIFPSASAMHYEVANAIANSNIHFAATAICKLDYTPKDDEGPVFVITADFLSDCTLNYN